jgi:hypothetical protein
MAMATPAEKLAESLDALREIQENGVVAIKTDALSRTSFFQFNGIRNT